MLSWFELPRPAVEPVIRALRLANTLLDWLFYDVNAVATDLLVHGLIVVADPGAAVASEISSAIKVLSTINLGALSNPEGAILVVDAGEPPHVSRYDDVPGFLARANGKGRRIRTASVTGVGSSALGSVAFGWNISTALDEPVAAIVPGYGVADVIQQALGGWFGFGLHNWWIKQMSQEVLARAAPQIAMIGRGLLKTAPDHAEAETGAPVFRRGSGSSDVLHDILKRAPNIERVFGHSKGALVIENALLDLPRDTTGRLQVTTFGCPIGETTPVGSYTQFLGILDWLGFLNSWGNRAGTMIATHHSTNTAIPLSMPVSELARSAPWAQANF
jgi:hypothetical protein